MKSAFKKIWMFFLVAAVSVLALLAVACSDSSADVPVPTNLSVSNNVLTWDAIAGTLSYDVKIDDGEPYSVKDPRFTLPINDYEFHSIAVRANTYDGTGEYCTPISYARRQGKTTLPQLATPTGISMTSNRLMWSAVMYNNGYRIYLDSTPIITKKNATYYDLEFPGDGTYYIRIQAIGDDVNYSTGKLSNAYAVTIKDGKAPFQKLPTVEFTFDVKTKNLVWNNRYSESAVSYVIYQEGVPDPVTIIPADSSAAKLSYHPDLNGSKVSYTMQLISNNGLYNPSDFNTKFTFPIADQAPADLTLSPDSSLGVYAFSWSGVTYKVGYALEIDGVEVDAGEELTLAVPKTLSAGRHVARVLAKGDGVWYADSILSEGIVFYTGDNGKMTTRLPAPVSPELSYKEGTLHLSVLSVDRAAKYRYEFTGGSGSYSLTAEYNVFDIKPTLIGDRTATTEEIGVISKLMADLENGVTVSAVAIPSDPLYAASPRSEERFFATGEGKTAVRAPSGFEYGSLGFVWSDVGEDYLYEIALDGEILDPTQPIVLSEGEHFARVRVAGEPAVWSKEICFRLPVTIDTPTNLSLSGNYLSFEKSNYASGYHLYANGKLLDSFYSDGEQLDLGQYITTDGEYVLQLVAYSGSNLYEDSAPSRQILYVKSDATSGTQFKPFLPQSAGELWAMMRQNPTSYVRLTSGIIYDFSDIDFERQSFLFSGVLIGNGAVLKGIKVSSPLFSALIDATIRDLTIEISADHFDYEKNGVLAAQMENTVLSDITVRLSDHALLTKETTFGLLTYKTENLTARDVTLDLNVTIESDMDFTMGAFAYNLNGSLSGITLSGSLIAIGNDLQIGALSAYGEVNLSRYKSTLSVTINATGNVSVGGCSLEGTIAGGTFDLQSSMDVNAATVAYYGVSKESLSLTDSRIGGSVTAQGSEVKLFGATGTKVISLQGVTVDTALKGKSTNLLIVAGLAKELSAKAVTTGASFKGSLDCNAPTVQAAGCAISVLGDHTLTSEAHITAAGKDVSLSAGAITAENLTLNNASVFGLDGVFVANVGGAALSIAEKQKEEGATIASTRRVTVSGTVEINATDCEELHFGGAVATGSQEIVIQNYRVVGSVQAKNIFFGGAICEGSNISLTASDLRVENTRLIGESVLAAGAILDAMDVTVAENGAFYTQIQAEGAGEISGVCLKTGSRSLKNIAIDGSLSLKGEGTLFGVADEVREAENISCSVDLSAEGAVTVYGAFRTLTTAKDISYREATVRIDSDQGAFYGIAQSLKDKKEITGATLSAVTLTAQPLTQSGTLDLFGLLGSAAKMQDVTLSDVAFTIGAFEKLTFGGVAEEVTESARNCAVNYSLTSDAALSVIGGAFLSATGNFYRVNLGKTNAPLTLKTTGEADLGGLVNRPETLTVENSDAVISLTLSAPAGTQSRAGGLFSSVSDSRHIVTLSECNNTITFSRDQGEGVLHLGGVTGELADFGKLVGAAVDLSAQGFAAQDRIGGVASEVRNATLQNCAAYGTITSAGAVGGLVCTLTRGTVLGGASALTITSSCEETGGLFATASGVLQNVYSISRLTDKGAGLFAVGEGISFTSGYFAGNAVQYALARKATNCRVSALYLDVALAGQSQAVVGEEDGTLRYDESSLSGYAYRSLGYGYRESELGDNFTADGYRYPYVTEIGRLPEEKVGVVQSCGNLEIEGSLDLYSALPRLYKNATVTWVDAGGCLSIRNGVAVVEENGSGYLYGFLSGGARAYSAFYAASGFVPLSGQGTEEDPYLITDLRYLHYVKDYSLADPSAYFRLELEEPVEEATEFPALFDQTTPFKGTFDFGGTVLTSPILPQDGLLGCLSGATVKNLRFCGVVGGTLLAASATDTVIQNVVIDQAYLSDGVVLVENLVGGAVKEVSVALSVITGEAVSACLATEATGTTFTKVQVLWRINSCDDSRFALVMQDKGSTYRSCAVFADPQEGVSAETEIAGLTFLANGTTYDRCAVLLRAQGRNAYPLIAEGTAAFSDVLVLFDGANDPIEGVTYATVATVKNDLAAMGFEEGDLPTPLGYDLFKESAEAAFEIAEETVTLSATRSFGSLLTILGDKPFATYVYYSFEGDCAVTEGDSLRPKKNGNGTLTVTNLYGVSYEIPVVVENYDGFADGNGTEEDPYLLSDFADFERMLSLGREGSAYFFLTDDIQGTLRKSGTFYGTLRSEGRTVTIDLACNSVLQSGYGIIDGVNFSVRKQTVVAQEESGLFANHIDGMTIKNATVTILCDSVTAEQDTCFGVFAGVMEGDATLKDVTVKVGGLTSQESVKMTITATDAIVGLLAGKADGVRLDGVTVAQTSVVELTGSGAVVFGSIGSLLGSDEFACIEGLTVDLELVAQADDLKLGGVAGLANAILENIDATVVLTVAGGSVTVGGVIGDLDGGTLSNGVVRGTISTQSAATVVIVGGVAGVSTGSVSDFESSVTVDVTAKGTLLVGGAVGDNDGTMQSLCVAADLTAHSTAQSAEIQPLLAAEKKQALVSLGGVAGRSTGTAYRLSASGIALSGSTDRTQKDLYVAVGGIAGSLLFGYDLEVKGGTILASGGDAVAAGVAGLLSRDLERVVVSDLALTGDSIAGAVGVFNGSEGTISDLFLPLSGLSEDEAALVASVGEGASISNGYYLSGKATGTEPSSPLTDVTKVGADAFLSPDLYGALDQEVWVVAAGSIPTLK